MSENSSYAKERADASIQCEQCGMKLFDANLSKPKDREEILFLVDYSSIEGEPTTWFGYFKDGKWFGNAADDEGNQEIDNGTVMLWTPLPDLHKHSNPFNGTRLRKGD